MMHFIYMVQHKLFRNVFIFTITNVINSAIPFILLPVLTRYLTASDYGIAATFQVLFSIIFVFVGLNMNGAVAVNFFGLKREELKIYIGNTLIIQFVSFILVLGIINIFKTKLSNFVKFPGDWLSIIVIIALSNSIIQLALKLWQVEKKPVQYGIFQILQTILNTALSIFFVVVLDWHWQGRLYGIIITTLAFGIISAFIIYKRNYLKFSIKKDYVKDALFFGIPLIPASLGWWVMTGIDRIFINSMVGIADTGIYTVGYQVGMIIGLLAISFNQAWVPFFYEKLKENEYSTNVRIVKLTYLFNIGIIALSLILSFITPFFLRFYVGKRFYFAYKFVVWIALGYAFNGMRFMVVNYFYYVKKTYISAWIAFFCAGVNIILNYFLIKANGAVGAAQATTISFFLSFIVTWILCTKVYKMPWLFFLEKKTS